MKVIPTIAVLSILYHEGNSFMSPKFATQNKIYQQQHQQHQQKQQQQNPRTTIKSSSVLALANDDDDISIDELKAQLSLYLKKREECNADEMAKQEIGKVIGGTKGNAVLEFVSGAPNKAFVIEEVPDIFDYEQLSKLGFSHLVTPIMNAGGRREMYSLMELPEPVIAERIKKSKKVPKLVIDTTGETDKARYSGLKITQITDDEEMGRQLAEFQRKSKEGLDVKPKLIEEDYVMPFADKRNVGPRQTPDWTPEMLDEEGRKVGQAQAWAKQARDGEFEVDPFELLSIEGPMQFYSIVTTLLVSFAFGNSSSRLLEQMLHYSKSDATAILGLLQAPAFVILLASFGSSVVCAAIFAPQKNRNSFVWAVKGFAGGLIAIKQLQELDTLVTRGEAAAAERANSS